MPELIEYLKNKGYDVGSFLTKFNISFQFIVINEFLIEKFAIAMYLSPYRMKIINYNGLKDNENEIIFDRELPADYKTNKTFYYALINLAFKHIQNTPF